MKYCIYSCYTSVEKNTHNTDTDSIYSIIKYINAYIVTLYSLHRVLGTENRTKKKKRLLIVQCVDVIWILTISLEGYKDFKSKREKV